jgi:hypothetical protein
MVVGKTISGLCKTIGGGAGIYFMSNIAAGSSEPYKTLASIATIGVYVGSAYSLGQGAKELEEAVFELLRFFKG